MKAFPKSNPCHVVVHHKGDLHIARAGIGKTSETASSTSAGIYAAEAAVRKYFGPRAHVTLDLKQNGDGCRNIPSIYTATASEPKKQIKLTKEEKRALVAVGEGCDVINPMLATTLRGIQKRSPELLWIGEAMGRYPAGAHHPYFGAKLTAAGKAALVTTNKGGAA
jgi:hypothetical protein